MAVAVEAAVASGIPPTTLKTLVESYWLLIDVSLAQTSGLAESDVGSSKYTFGSAMADSMSK